MGDLNTQVALQCKAVVHMCEALAEVYRMKQRRHEEGGKAADDLADLTGRWSAETMETLGDILNGMDAVDEDEDGWIDPVIREAQRRWPVAR